MFQNVSLKKWPIKKYENLVFPGEHIDLNQWTSSSVTMILTILPALLLFTEVITFITWSVNKIQYNALITKCQGQAILFRYKRNSFCQIYNMYISQGEWKRLRCKRHFVLLVFAVALSYGTGILHQISIFDIDQRNLSSDTR